MSLPWSPALSCDLLTWEPRLTCARLPRARSPCLWWPPGCSLRLTPAVPRWPPVVTGRCGGLARALVPAWGQAGVPRTPHHGLGSRGAGGAAQTSVLTLRLREKASRMADRRLGLSACSPPKPPGDSSASSWPTLW